MGGGPTISDEVGIGLLVGFVIIVVGAVIYDKHSKAKTEQPQDESLDMKASTKIHLDEQLSSPDGKLVLLKW